MKAILRTRLRQIINSSQMTTYQLAERSGVHVSLIYRILSGQTADPTYSTLCRLADALGVSIAEFREPASMAESLK